MEASQNSALEMYRLDLEELTKFIEMSKRPNIKRQLESIKQNLTFQMEEEKKNIAKKEKEEQSKPKTEEKTNETASLSIQFQTVTK